MSPDESGPNRTETLTSTVTRLDRRRERVTTTRTSGHKRTTQNYTRTRPPLLFFGQPGGTHVCLWPPSAAISTRSVPDTKWVRLGVTTRTRPNTPGEVVPSVKWMYGGLVLRTVVRLVPGRIGDRLSAWRINPALWLMAMPANCDPATYGGERLADFVAKHGEDGLARAREMSAHRARRAGRDGAR